MSQDRRRIRVHKPLIWSSTNRQPSSYRCLNCSRPKSISRGAQKRRLQRFANIIHVVVSQFGEKRQSQNFTASLFRMWEVALLIAQASQRFLQVTRQRIMHGSDDTPVLE